MSKNNRVPCRTTTHQGKGKGSAKHNSHHWKDDDQRDVRLANIIRGNDDPDFYTAEMDFYKKRYGKQLQLQNQKYIAKRNYGRCKDMKQFYASKQYAPTEKILQYGNCKIDKQLKPDRETFEDMVETYLEMLSDWNEKHGNHLHLLNCAIHFDGDGVDGIGETSNHSHLRFIWDYTDDDGVIRCEQEKAMEKAGLELPKPDKPKGQYNNRNITFTNMIRDMWNDVCEQYGFPVIRERDETRVKPHQEVKTSKGRNALDLQAEEDALDAERLAFEEYKTQELKRMETERLDQEVEYNLAVERNSAVFERGKILKAEVDSLVLQKDQLTKDIEKLEKKKTSAYFKGSGQIKRPEQIQLQKKIDDNRDLI